MGGYEAVEFFESTVLVDSGAMWMMPATSPSSGARGSFAGSVPGQILLSTGARDVRAQVRVERWDARPPWQAEWEDRAELVYRALDPEDAILTLYGNPDEAGGEIDLSGMRHVRVVVLARGRYDSEDDDGRADLARLPVEQWLVQLYPDPVEGGTNPLDLEPPRLAEDRRLTTPGSAWLHAIGAATQAGWSEQILGTGSLARLLWGLKLLGRPATVEELVACTSFDWSDAPAGASTRLALHAWGDGSRPLTTWDEHVDAYVALRILALDDARTRVVFPHPSPQQTWHRAGIGPEELRRARQTATVRYAALAEDVMGLLDWQADGRLDVTLHRLAIRLACSVTALEGALASLESGRMATVVRSDEAVGRHRAVVVKTPY